MKAKFIMLGVISSLFLLGCSSTEDYENEIVVLSQYPENVQDMILLQDINTGDLVCCRSTEFSTAEDCARALEQNDCYVRVQNIPFGIAKYDHLTVDTYPTRRWRENETSPRW